MAETSSLHVGEMNEAPPLTVASIENHNRMQAEKEKALEVSDQKPNNTTAKKNWLSAFKKVVGGGKNDKSSSDQNSQSQSQLKEQELKQQQQQQQQQQHQMKQQQSKRKIIVSETPHPYDPPELHGHTDGDHDQSFISTVSSVSQQGMVVGVDENGGSIVMTNYNNKARTNPSSNPHPNPHRQTRRNLSSSLNQSHMNEVREPTRKEAARSFVSDSRNENENQPFHQNKPPSTPLSSTLALKSPQNQENSQQQQQQRVLSPYSHDTGGVGQKTPNMNFKAFEYASLSPPKIKNNDEAIGSSPTPRLSDSVQSSPSMDMRLASFTSASVSKRLPPPPPPLVGATPMSSSSSSQAMSSQLKVPSTTNEQLLLNEIQSLTALNNQLNEIIERQEQSHFQEKETLANQLSDLMGRCDELIKINIMQTEEIESLDDALREMALQGDAHAEQARLMGIKLQELGVDISIFSSSTSSSSAEQHSTTSKLSSSGSDMPDTKRNVKSMSGEAQPLDTMGNMNQDGEDSPACLSDSDKPGPPNVKALTKTISKLLKIAPPREKGSSYQGNTTGLADMEDDAGSDVQSVSGKRRSNSNISDIRGEIEDILAERDKYQTELAYLAEQLKKVEEEVTIKVQAEFMNDMVDAMNQISYLETTNQQLMAESSSQKALLDKAVEKSNQLNALVQEQISIINDLSSKLESSTDTKNELATCKAKLNEVTSSMQALQDSHRLLQIELQATQNQSSATEKELSSLRSSFRERETALFSKIEDGREKQRQQKDTIARLENDNELLQQKNESLKQHLTRLEAELVDLHESRIKEKGALTTEKSKLEVSLEQEVRVVRDLRAQIKESTSEHTAEVARLESQIKRLEAEVDVAKAAHLVMKESQLNANQSHEEALISSRNLILELQQELSSLESQRQEEKKAATTTYNELVSNVASLERKIKSLQEAMATMSNERERDEQRLLEMKQECLALEGQRDEEKRACASWEKKVASLLEQVSTLTNEKAQDQSVISDLRQQLTQSDFKIEEEKNATAVAVKEMAMSQSTLEKKLQSLQQSLLTLTQERTQEREVLNRRISTLHDLNNELQAKVDASDRKISALECSNEVDRHERAIKLEQVEAALEEATRQIKQMSEDKNSLSETVSAFELRATRLQEENASLKSSLSLAEMEKRQANDKAARAVSFETALIETRQALSSLTENYANVTREKEALISKVETLEEANDRDGSMLSDLKSQNEEQAKELEVAATNFTRQKKTLDRITGERDELQKRITDLQHELVELEDGSADTNDRLKDILREKEILETDLSNSKEALRKLKEAKSTTEHKLQTKIAALENQLEKQVEVTAYMKEMCSSERKMIQDCRAALHSVGFSVHSPSMDDDNDDDDDANAKVDKVHTDDINTTSNIDVPLTAQTEEYSNVAAVTYLTIELKKMVNAFANIRTAAVDLCLEVASEKESSYSGNGKSSASAPASPASPNGGGKLSVPLSPISPDGPHAAVVGISSFSTLEEINRALITSKDIVRLAFLQHWESQQERLREQEATHNLQHQLKDLQEVHETLRKDKESMEKRLNHEITILQEDLNQYIKESDLREEEYAHELEKQCKSYEDRIQRLTNSLTQQGESKLQLEVSRYTALLNDQIATSRSKVAALEEEINGLHRDKIHSHEREMTHLRDIESLQMSCNAQTGTIESLTSELAEKRQATDAALGQVAKLEISLATEIRTRQEYERILRRFGPYIDLMDSKSGNGVSNSNAASSMNNRDVATATTTTAATASNVGSSSNVKLSSTSHHASDGVAGNGKHVKHVVPEVDEDTAPLGSTTSLQDMMSSKTMSTKTVVMTKMEKNVPKLINTAVKKSPTLTSSSSSSSTSSSTSKLANSQTTKSSSPNTLLTTSQDSKAMSMKPTNTTTTTKVKAKAALKNKEKSAEWALKSKQKIEEAMAAKGWAVSGGGVRP